MSNLIFIQVQGRPGIHEANLPPTANLGELQDVLVAAGIIVDDETFIFIDDAGDHLHGERHHPVHGLKHGCRVHVSHCKRIKAAVHFLERTEEHEFPPGARVRAVKAQAVHEFQMTPKDAAEHVLQLSGSKDRPPSDTPLHELTEGHGCAVCFDLVPEKRVEG